ncbi:restriction endonuclease [Flavobacterium artemisiae]|uniref:Restriction endonuclease n=1 Tax=Flavobacterium artemisiae TaxID=2126556 RepID=A0ABW4HIN9_9FLAO
MSKKVKDKSYLLTSPESKIFPPADTKISELPIEKLSWVDFERLCLRLVEVYHSIDNCEIYGVSGSKQEGIDIFAFKDSNKYECFQCKRYQVISPGKLDEIVQEFKNGEWYSKSDKFFLCTSLELNSTGLQDKFNKLKSDLKKDKIDLIKWDSVQINRILKKHPIIVRNFFGDEWCKLFCGMTCVGSKQLEIESIMEELASLRELILDGQKNVKLNSIIEDVYDKEYYWIESEKVILFNKALEDYNDTIIDKREKFTFSQNIIQSIFDLSELKEIVNDWLKDSWTPENLDHLRFIHTGLLAYSCLDKIPKDVLMDLKLLNWCPIHDAYFSGHLSVFIREIKVSMALKLDLIKKYSSDRYLFENLTRIINSLKRYLEFDVNELYIEKPKAAIIRNLPKKFILVVTSSELTLRNPKNLNQVYAKLPLDKQLKVSAIQVVRTLESTIIVGVNARDCFYWNPEKDLIANFFYHASEKERINDVFCKINNEGEIVTTIQIGVKMLIFNNFCQFKSYYMEFYLKLTPYKNSFVGIKRNFLNSNNSLVYQVAEDFQFIPIVTIESIRTSVRNFKEINEWLQLLDSDEEFSFLYELQNIDLQVINHHDEELILLRGSIDGTGVFLLIRLIKNDFQILNIHHLKESISTSMDYIESGSDLKLLCAYLDLSRRDTVFEVVKIKNFNIVESKTITRVRKNDNCRDVIDISVGDDGLVYLNEMGDKILLYSEDEQDFEEFNFGEEIIHFIKYYK